MSGRGRGEGNAYDVSVFAVTATLRPQHAHLMAESSPLWGGACAMGVPAGWRDVSELRQVPDNQEAFVSATDDASLCVELLQRVAAPDEGAMRYLWDDLSETNGPGGGAASGGGGGSSTLQRCVALPLAAAPGVAGAASLVAIAVGRQLVQRKGAEPEETELHLVLVRLPQFETDVLFTHQRGAAGGGGGGEVGECPALMAAVLAFTIIDEGLFSA